MTRILIGGDVCPVGSIEDEFIGGNAAGIFHDLLDEIRGADLSVVNLECPLVIQKTPIAKCGPALSARSECAKGFAAAGWNVVNLANNHSYDQGARGLQETMDAVRGSGLGVLGAGRDFDEAERPYVANIRGQRIVLFAMAEREFSVAGRGIPGANPLDLINCVSAIRRHKQDGLFIVLIHGGQEHYPYPSPELARRCRFMIDMGADAVVCCHAHCPLPWETYAGRPIVYGLGNLIFEDLGKVPEAWHEGYLARLDIEEGKIRFEPVPYFQSRGGAGARKMNAPESEAFLEGMREKCAQIGRPGFLEDRWAEYCRGQRDTYFSLLLGFNRVMDRMRRLLLRTLYSEEALLCALNLSQCETHREVLESILRDERAKS